MAESLAVLRERYEIKLQAYVEASRKAEAELGPVQGLGSGPVPSVSQAWIDAVEELRRIEPEYIKARDEYWAAAKKAQ
jgi:hypothetical protein